MRKSAFAICDDHNAYIGYTNGDLWNGWATPYFTLEEAQKLQADWNKNAEFPMFYDVNKDEFRVQYDGDDEPYIWKGEDIKTESGTLHLYGIGAYSHIWDELDNSIKRSLAQQIHDFLYDYDLYEYRDTVNDEDEFINDIIAEFDNLERFVKVYEIMYNDAYNADEIHEKLTDAFKRMTTHEEWYEAVRKELTANYSERLDAEAVEDATIDIVDRCFCYGVPTLAELPEYIADYMNR